VQAQLVPERGQIAPGGDVQVALEEVIHAGWHTFWINPGDAGLPTEIRWTLPPGWKASAVRWPFPERLPYGPLMTYGYRDKVWLLTEIAAPANASPGETVTLRAHVNWLACQEVCIPESADLEVTLQVSELPAPPLETVEGEFMAAWAKLPAPLPWPARFHGGQLIDLFIESPALSGARLKQSVFFPLAEGWIDGMASQQVMSVADGLLLQLRPGKKANDLPELSGVLVLTASDDAVQAFDVTARGDAPSASNAPAKGDGLDVALALAFALLGGLALNFMPCVLPILAMKALAFSSRAADRKGARREGLAYATGAVASIVALGLAIILLRIGGKALGWGFQLQEPAVVLAFALLMFAVGLNLSGVLVLPRGLSGGGALAGQAGAAGAFFTGVLAVAVAAPCTAPFMAAALGFALTQRTAIALAIFVALGIGFALPFAAVACAPPLLRVIPKPGAWMQYFRQALAFPMYGTALWLLWVLGREAGVNAIILGLAGMISLALAAWSWMSARNAAAHQRSIGMTIATAALAVTVSTLYFVRAPESAPRNPSKGIGGLSGEAYSEARLAGLRALNRAVFINATAAWCITCLLNEKTTLSRESVRDAFVKNDITYLVADWTNRDAEISALLSAYDRAGVPLYLYYPPAASGPVVLPQLLTQGTVLSLIEAQPHPHVDEQTLP
jgi:thiol:disulfide interchange protein DsbD